MKTIFRNDRVKEIANERMPIKFLNYGKIVLHLIAEESPRIDRYYNIETIIRNPKFLKPIKYMGMEISHTFDGMLTYTTDLSGVARSYVHLYRKGIIEAVEGSLLKPVASKLEIPSIAYEEEILKALPDYIEVFKRISVNPPFSMFLSLVQVQNYQMKLNRDILGVNPIPIDHDELKLDEIYVEDYSQTEDIPRLVQPWFDDIWNACGMFKSFNYDEDGNWGYGLNCEKQ